MLRFFSKRVGRNAQKYKTVDDGRAAGAPPKPKHILPCKVMLLDDSNLSFDLPVSNSVYHACSGEKARRVSPHSRKTTRVREAVQVGIGASGQLTCAPPPPTERTAATRPHNPSVAIPAALCEAHLRRNSRLGARSVSFHLPRASWPRLGDAILPGINANRHFKFTICAPRTRSRSGECVSVHFLLNFYIESTSYVFLLTQHEQSSLLPKQKK